MKVLPQNILVSGHAGRTLYINRSNDMVLDSQDFEPEALRAIADHIESNTPVAIPLRPAASLAPRATLVALTH